MNSFGLFLLVISSTLTFYSIDSGYDSTPIAHHATRAPASLTSQMPSVLHFSHAPKKHGTHRAHA
jgi:hypothetical protein